MNPFVWDPSVGQYRYPNGRFVPRSVVRAAIDKALDAERKKVRSLAISLRMGGITLMAWRQAMRDAIKAIHLYNAAIARGGWSQLTQADFGRVGNTVRGEYIFLERLAEGISTEQIALDGAFIERAGMYAEAGRQTYHDIERLVMVDAGFRYESNVLSPVENCKGANSCVEQTEQGRVRIGKLVGIGKRRCLRNCRCELAYWRNAQDT